MRIQFAYMISNDIVCLSMRIHYVEKRRYKTLSLTSKLIPRVMREKAGENKLAKI